METSRQQVFIDYCSYLYSTGKTYRKIGVHLGIVQHFIENAPSLDIKGYKTYMRANAIKLSENIEYKGALCEFMAFIGQGFRCRKASRRCKPLERLSSISEKNQKLINDFINHLMENEDYSASTLTLYSYTAKTFFEYANTLSMDNCRRFLAMLEDKGLSPKTIRLRITALERLGEFAKVPIRLKRPKIPKSLDTDNVPSISEYNKLLEYLLKHRNRDYYFFIRILATTGARVSEFLKITWEDIIAGEVTIKGKGSKYRRLFFNRGLQKEVREYVEQTGKTGLVTGMTSRGLNAIMKDWGDKCGIDRSKMHPHAFRHFFAKMFLKSNKDVVQLADLLGHGSVDTTRIYLQKSYDEQKRDFNRHVTW